jgi:membrane-associated phospholipid phosphatase
MPAEPVTSVRMDESALARGGTVPSGPMPSRGTSPDPHGPGPDDPEPPAIRSPWLVPGGLALVLVLLTVNVLADGPLVGADRRIRTAVQAQATSATWRWLRDSWHAPAQLIVDLGNYPEAIAILAACAVVVAARHRTFRPLLAAFAAVVLLPATVIPAKILIGRTGPGLATVGSGGLGVFPSGHATTAAVCWGVAVMLLRPDLPGRIGRAAVAAVAAVCLLVGVALVWCDYHWFTDVVAGWALAGLIAAAAGRVAQGPLPQCWLPPRGRGRG